LFNCISAQVSTIAGGAGHTASGCYSFIGGGGSISMLGNHGNIASGYQSTAVGGGDNLASGDSSFIGGGGGGGGFSPSKRNTASGTGSVVVGGFCNTSSEYSSFVGGGINNDARGACSAVLGGSGNIVCNSWSGAFGCNVNNNIACSFFSNQLGGTNLVGTTVNLCVGTNGVIVRGVSDGRLKTNICNLTYGLCDVRKLNPVSFDWNEKERETRGYNKQIGFIAQEVEPIIPEAVGQRADNGEYSLSVDKIIPVLTKALQELSAKFDAQEERISILEDIIKRNNLK
jgi:hypothetical protein